MALAVGGIGQAMQKHDRADRRSLRLEHKGPIEILREVSRIDRTALEIAIGRHTIGRIELPGDLALDVVKDPGLSRQIFRPIGRIEFSLLSSCGTWVCQGSSGSPLCES